ncbi:UNVERIFIED_ORG: hypothetical protein M2438_002509 [Methylobacterium sp. SuP10 SLI 274]|uniref:hypothetical protein n=1 Tax=Methylorubrum extorquens TaxID=408 RepID=UPI0020A020ED|nr:hypothetical protein [Methylorubrum extorquens]MDF9863734.1 hypothetical protein [Methylorubrum pseudosasae]MDH6637334.1 hypothetical protein [Methylobacterium sp. SuP10 SLI 274]MDH6666514.1 hypothetical protein [Methylorubrum zatmanii]MCP1558425.1 hypothetical protein [Methylorubrum extorquens]MDF9792045.1 hypothetical protein [Methylorubrum extorquens]
MILGWFECPACPEDRTSFGVVGSRNTLLLRGWVPAREWAEWIDRQGYAIVQRTRWGHQAAIEPHDLVAIKLRWG